MKNLRTSKWRKAIVVGALPLALGALTGACADDDPDTVVDEDVDVEDEETVTDEDTVVDEETVVDEQTETETETETESS